MMIDTIFHNQRSRKVTNETNRVSDENIYADGNH